jgi:aspartate/methionine/tyrosine aminotransferase
MNAPSRLTGLWSSAAPAPLAAAAEALRAAGRPPLDLIAANPHDHGLVFPAERLRAIVDRALAASAVARYEPDPLGAPDARRAVAEFYRRRGWPDDPLDPARIVLAPGTSQAYFYALRLLTDPGDEVLVASPGYPLLDDLCAVAGVGLRRYHLKCDAGQWRPDVAEIDFQCTPRTRAVMVVSPHNPTGCMFTAADYAALGEVCRQRGLALVVDEVFSECLAPITGSPPASSSSIASMPSMPPSPDLAVPPPLPRPNPADFPLVLILNGVSKMLSLPGWKLAWMAVGGDPARVAPFMNALERLSDTFLPVPDLQQAMLPDLLAAGDGVDGEAGACGGRVIDEIGMIGVIGDLAAAYARRRSAALEALTHAGFRPDACPAGVYLCPRLPERVGSPADASIPADEAFALDALDHAGVLIHPGHYYGLPNHWVMTCVAGEGTLEAAIGRIAGVFT